MSHRFPTWWRALSVVLLGLATFTWPSAAQAETTPSVTVVHQQATTTLSGRGAGSFSTTLRLRPESANTRVDVTIYPALVGRSQLEAIVAGEGTSESPLSSTGNVPLACAEHGVVSFTITLATTGGVAAPTCDAVHPRLRLDCTASLCDGVYPLRYVVDLNGTRIVSWSLLAIRTSGSITPLQVALVETMTSGSLAHPNAALGALHAIAKLDATPLTLSANYKALAPLDLDPSTAATWKGALTDALASSDHEALAAAPSSTDFAGLVDHGLATQVALQFSLSASLLHDLTGRFVAAPVLVSGRVTSYALRDLAKEGSDDVVLPEGDLTQAPSETLTWGEPFHPSGAPTATALAADGPLSRLLSDTSVSPGERTTLVLATLAFLHYEEPNVPTSRSVVIEAPLQDTSKTLLEDLADALSDNPYVSLTTLTPLFDSALIGADGAPSARALARPGASPWSGHNVSSLVTLIGQVNSYAQGIKSGDEGVALHVAVAQAEIRGSPATRQSAIDAASATLESQLALFSIDSSAITLAGLGNSLPITLLSRAPYKVVAVAHLLTDGISFPKGDAVSVTMASPTESVSVPTANPRGSSLTLQVVLTTPNGQLVIARSAIQVRIAGASVVGYLLIIASLVVLGWWWWRTNRRRPKGRHAR